MNAFLFRQVGSAMLAVLMVAFSGVAAAATAPEIASFEAATVDELTPGTELRFRVTGTPGAQATVRIPGLKQPIRLDETRSGVYEGRYTLKRNDRPAPDGAVRATLRRQNVAVTSRLATPLSTAGAPASAGIHRFTMEPRTIEPGAELTFSLQGIPGGKATVDLEGTGRAVALTETQPGVYEGTYTVRRQDRFRANNVSATLQANNRVVRTRLSTAAAAPPAPPVPAITTIEFLTPGDQAQIGTGPVEIRGRSAPNSTFNVHVNAMSTLPLPSVLGGNRILLARQVQTDSRGNFAFTFDPRDDQPAGTRYEVIVDGVIAGAHKQSKLTLVQR